MAKPTFLKERKAQQTAASQSLSSDEPSTPGAQTATVQPLDSQEPSTLAAQTQSPAVGLAAANQEPAAGRVSFSKTELTELRGLALSRGYPPDRLRSFIMALARGAR